MQKTCENEHRSELIIHFGAKEVRYRPKYTIFFLAELQHQKRISLLLIKSSMQNYFHNVQVSCDCCVTWHETRTVFSLHYSHLR